MKKKVVKESNKKVENKRLFNNKLIAVLFTGCALMWVMSGILNIVADGNAYIWDFIAGIILLALGVLYFIKAKKEK